MKLKLNLTNFLTNFTWSASSLLIALAASLGTTATLADEPAAAMQGNAMSQIIFFAAIFAIFYFFVIRPQSKRTKEHRNLIASVTKGDEVITTGGILGRISKVTDGFFVLMVADGVEITVQKQAIVNALPKGTLKSL